MDNRCMFVASFGKTLEPIEGSSIFAPVAAPIIAAGDVIGAVCVLSNDIETFVNEGDLKLFQVAASFLGKQMEV